MKRRDELAIHDGFLYRGGRVIILQKLTTAMREEIHSSHLRIQSCLRRARECIFWPAVNAEIKDLISEWEVCQAYSCNQQKKTLLLLVEVPERPWEIISADLFVWNGKNYLLTVNHYSNFIEINKLQNTHSKAVVKKLKAHISRCGRCDILISGNGPQFNSTEL